MSRPHQRLKQIACLLLISLFTSPVMLNAAEKPKEDILVAAAASLKDVLDEIGPIFEKSNPGLRVNFQLGASGALQQQIEQENDLETFSAISNG